MKRATVAAFVSRTAIVYALFAFAISLLLGMVLS